MDKQLHIIL